MFGWVHGVEADAAHHLLPTHPDVITEVLARIEELRRRRAPHRPADRAVLHRPHRLGRPARVPGPAGHHRPPARTSTCAPPASTRAPSRSTPLTAVADYYTADLAARRPRLRRGPGGARRRPARRAAPGTDRGRRALDGRPGRPAVRGRPPRPRRAAWSPSARRTSAHRCRSCVSPSSATRCGSRACCWPHMAPSPLRDALTHLRRARRGVHARARRRRAGRRPTRTRSRRSPVAAPFDLGDVAGRHVGGRSHRRRARRARRRAGRTTSRRWPRSSRPDPTHLSYGMSMPVPLAGAVDGPDGRARVRLRPRPDRARRGRRPRHRDPPQLLRVELDLARADGWLVGGPGLSDVDGRLRRLQLGVTATPARRRGRRRPSTRSSTRPPGAAPPSPGPGSTTRARASLVGAGVRRGARRQPRRTGPATRRWPTRWPRSGWSATDAAGVTGLAADAFAALRTDPVAYLGARVPGGPGAARRLGRAGPRQGTDGAYRYARPGSPYDLFARPEGAAWRTGIETTTSPQTARCGSPPTSTSRCRPSRRPSRSAPTWAWSRCATGPWTARSPSTSTRSCPASSLLPTPTLAELGAQLDAALPDILATGVLGTVLGQVVPGV